MVILENIDIYTNIDKAILQNIDIDKITKRFKFGISNRAITNSPQHITSLLKEIPTKVIHHNVSDLPGLLLLVALAIHSAVSHQLTCT